MTATSVRLLSTLTVITVSISLAPNEAAGAAEVGTVSPATAAAQLERGMTSAMTPAAAGDELSGLQVRAAGSMSGYSRDVFPHWRDASDNGWPTAPNDKCNARNAALHRDGADVTMSATCTKLEGTWVDPYSAKKYDASSDIDIDHIVPLANAWRSGADGWTTAQRTGYANDPLVLVSADDSLNQAKGDKGPEEWTPPLKESGCLYAVRWTFTKAKYRLSVTSAEKSAVSSLLQTC